MEKLPCLMTSGLGLAAALEIARVRGSTNNLGGGLGSSSSLSSEDDSKSSIALGWVWMVSKKEVGEVGPGVERIVTGVIPGEMLIERGSSIGRFRSESGRGGVVGSGATIWNVESSESAWRVCFDWDSEDDTIGGGEKTLLASGWLEVVDRGGGGRAACARELDRGGGGRAACARELDSRGGGDMALVRGGGVPCMMPCRSILKRDGPA